MYNNWTAFLVIFDYTLFTLLVEVRVFILKNTPPKKKKKIAPRCCGGEGPAFSVNGKSLTPTTARQIYGSIHLQS
jgi:hypothetical protein